MYLAYSISSLLHDCLSETYNVYLYNVFYFRLARVCLVNYNDPPTIYNDHPDIYNTSDTRIIKLAMDCWVSCGLRVDQHICMW